MSKLREAAQFLLTAVEDEGVRGMDTALDALREALREDALAEMQALTESEYQEDAEFNRYHNALAIEQMETEERENALVRLSETHQQLDAELGATEPVTLYVRDDEYEYNMWGDLELIGTIDGTYGGRWMIAAFAENASAVWPDGTAIYVKRVKR